MVFIGTNWVPEGDKLSFAGRRAEQGGGINECMSESRRAVIACEGHEALWNEGLVVTSDV